LPFINTGTVRLFYRLEGRPELPILVLSHSLGCDHGMWEPQVSDLLQRFRLLRYDTRGHGASDVVPGEYSIEMLGRDVLALCDALNIKNFAFCGLSMGGAVGQWLGLNAPERLTTLILANTSPQFGTRETWEARLQAVRQGGMAGIEEAVLQRFFSPANRASTWAHSVRAVFLATDPKGYAGCCVALRDVHFKDAVNQIKTPTLVIGSEGDPSTPWEGNGDILARNIPAAKAVVLRGAHLSNLEQPRSFTAAVLEFLIERNPQPDRLDAGMRMRREVMGDEHVERAIALSSDFNRDFQMLITRYTWGTIWTRPGLDVRTRTLLSLAILPSLGRWEEFRLHVRAALAHGMESCDLKEVLLHVAVYAGVPAANTGFQIAREELEKLSV